MEKNEEKEEIKEEEEITPCEWLLMKLEEISYNYNYTETFGSFNILDTKALFEILDEMMKKPSFVKPKPEQLTKPVYTRIVKKGVEPDIYYEKAEDYEFTYDGCRIIMRLVYTGETPKTANKIQYALVQVYFLKSLPEYE